MTAARRPHRLMIVDDEPTIITLIRVIALGLWPDINVKTADNGDAAIPLALQFEPDLLLLDLKMPGKGGFEVIEALRVHDALATTPIVVMTGLNTHSVLTRIQSLDGVGMLPKPLEVGSIRDALTSHLPR